MPVTSANALPYPASTDAPRGDTAIQALAEQADLVIVAMQGATTDLEVKAAPDASTSLPEDPVDGQVAYFNVPAGGDNEYAVVWVMRYTTALGIWQAIGGTPAAARNDDSGTRVAGAANYDDLSGTATGPAISIPSGYTGTVKVRIEARIQVAGSPGGIGRASFRVGSDTPLDTNAVTDDGTLGNGTSVRTSGAFSVSGGDVITMKYSRAASPSGTTTIGKRYIEVWPLTADPV